jgi:hypothetical protein
VRLDALGTLPVRPQWRRAEPMRYSRFQTPRCPGEFGRPHIRLTRATAPNPGSGDTPSAEGRGPVRR